MIFFGIDPGASGAIAYIDEETGAMGFIKNSETYADVHDFIADTASYGQSFAVIERVSAMPKQGVSSTFKFGQSFGFLLGILTASKIPHELVTPVTWQNAMKCRSGGDKNVTKAAAQRLFPDMKITHANADALLLAEYARRSRTVTVADTQCDLCDGLGGYAIVGSTGPGQLCPVCNGTGRN